MWAIPVSGLRSLEEYPPATVRATSVVLAHEVGVIFLASNVVSAAPSV